jgi:hypothetical protein
VQPRAEATPILTTVVGIVSFAAYFAYFDDSRRNSHLSPILLFLRRILILITTIGSQNSLYPVRWEKVFHRGARKHIPFMTPVSKNISHDLRPHHKQGRRRSPCQVPATKQLVASEMRSFPQFESTL